MNVKLCSLFLLPAILLAPVASVYADENSGLSDDQKGAISQSCSTIKQTLKTLQRSDSRTRSFLGASYETFLSSYITPLNISIVRAGQSDVTISALNASLIEKRQNFVAEFTNYSQSLDELIDIDCQNDPERFYQKLVDTRKGRTQLESTVEAIRTNLVNHYTAVKKFQEQMDE